MDFYPGTWTLRSALHLVDRKQNDHRFLKAQAYLRHGKRQCFVHRMKDCGGLSWLCLQYFPFDPLNQAWDSGLSHGRVWLSVSMDRGTKHLEILSALFITREPNSVSESL